MAEKLPDHKWKRERMHPTFIGNKSYISILWSCKRCGFSKILSFGQVPDKSELPNCHEALVRRVLEE